MADRIPLSPLRYPGGKTRFVPHLLDWLGERRFDAVVEPFAGGASVGLGMLRAGVVEETFLSDADRLVSSFWMSAAFHTRSLIETMFAEPVTVTRWKHWKTSSEDDMDMLGRALAALFLNRTSFSGLIRHGSVLGGVNQDEVIAAGGNVKYPVGCRFNKESLAESIRRVGKWQDEGRLHAKHADYRSALRDVSGNVMVYLDPPYVDKSTELYGHCFDVDDHKTLAETVLELDVPFVLSYDDVPLVRSLYEGEEGVHILKPAWAYGMGKSKTSREILITNIEGDTDVFG